MLVHNRGTVSWQYRALAWFWFHKYKMAEEIIKEVKNRGIEPSYDDMTDAELQAVATAYSTSIAVIRYGTTPIKMFGVPSES